ncbi:hypothetical protein E4U53_005571 [Claviceps sorghi]|nr:hypothetical protein E4U53_005571 [Claviceps sorghi]
MSHPVRRMASSTAPGSSGEAHPTTATVLDYNCLFTHDLKRKQKRWQDGKLKYHTFNRKIMVYDDRGNFIGDAHWQAGGDLQEDEELDLDRGAAIVQVGDFVGSREQDLTDVLDKRAREVEKRRAVAAAKTPASSRARAGPPPATAVVTTHFQLNHRPLASIVPSPGPLGRASIPNQSPYEARRADNFGAPQEPDVPSTRKRRRSPSPPSRAGFARSLFGAALSLSSSAGGSANRRFLALKERAVNAQEALRRETSDDDVVVVAQRPRMKASLPQPQPRYLEGTAFKRPLEASREEMVSGQDHGPSESRHIRGQLASRLRRDMDSSPTRPERPSDLLGDESRRAQTGEDELVEQHNAKRSDVVRSATENSRLQRRTISTPLIDVTRALREGRQSTLTSDEGGDTNKADEPLRLTPTTHQPKHGIATTQNDAPSELSETAHSKPQERRTELRIRSRKRRGLLMVAEMRQGRHALQSSAFTEPDAQSMNADCSVEGRKPRNLSPDAGGTTKLDEYTMQATAEHTSKSTSAPEAESAGDASCDGLAPKRLPDQPADAEHAFFDPVGVLGAGDKQSECPEQMVDGVAEHPRQRRQWSLETTQAGAFVESRKLSDSAEMDDVESHISLDSDKTPAASPGKEKTEAILTGEEQIEMTKVVIEEETPQPERSELTGIVGAQTRRRTMKPEVSPANISTDEESDVPTARKRRPRNRIEPPPSGEEIPACHAPTRRRSSKMKRASPDDAAFDGPGGESERDPQKKRPATQSDGYSETDTAEDASKGESDCASRKGPKRRRSKKDSDVTAAHQTAKPDGPRIKRMARKSVKSKEIFGFVASVEIGPASASPFAMTASRVGIVGRPPSAPKRLPGICLTMKPALRSHDGDTTERLDADKVEHATPGGKHGHYMAAQRVSDEAGGAAMTTRTVPDQDADGLPVSKENAPIDGLVPRAKIANPATRGKKAARKTDAAGQAPQHVVPFEPPQPARPVPKTGPSGPSGPNARDAILPGFTTAKGGAWSAHAEDLLGMTRPVGKGRR